MIIFAHEFAGFSDGFLETAFGFGDKCELEECTFKIFDKLLCEVAPSGISNEVDNVLDIGWDSLASVVLADYGGPPGMASHLGPDYF